MKWKALRVCAHMLTCHTHACARAFMRTPNLPTKIIPTKIARLKTYGQLPMDMIIPPLN